MHSSFAMARDEEEPPAATASAKAPVCPLQTCGKRRGLDNAEEFRDWRPESPYDRKSGLTTTPSIKRNRSLHPFNPVIQS